MCVQLYRNYFDIDLSNIHEYSLHSLFAATECIHLDWVVPITLEHTGQQLAIGLDVTCGDRIITGLRAAPFSVTIMGRGPSNVDIWDFEDISISFHTEEGELAISATSFLHLDHTGWFNMGYFLIDMPLDIASIIGIEIAGEWISIR